MPVTISYEIYLDDLPNLPYFGDTSNTFIEIVDLRHNFGIPSVRTFQIYLSRNFHNLHSQYKFLPEDREILNIKSNSTGKSWEIIGYTSLSVNLKSIGTEISSNEYGYYDLSHTDFSNIQGYYTSSITVSNGHIGWTETLKNLRGSHVVPKSLTHNHYCDYGSFIRSNGQNGQINEPSLNLVSRLDNITICEISNISLLGSNLGGIIAREYTDHTKKIQDHTLLYIDGKFQTNAQRPYPNTYHFSWNGHSSIQDFSAGTISYDLDGSMSETNPEYKWIGFILNYNILESDPEGGFLLDLETFFSKFFHQSITSEIVNQLDDPNNNVIGFVQQEYTIYGDQVTRIGNINLLFNGSSKWYGKSSGIKYDVFNADDKYYGVRTQDGRKLLFPSKAKTDDFGEPDSTIYLYIGVKNNFS